MIALYLAGAAIWLTVDLVLGVALGKCIKYCEDRRDQGWEASR